MIINTHIPSVRAARDWFAEASRCYLEEHQGCPSCARRHCVIRARWGSRLEYHCVECDFSTAHDDESGIYAVADGQPTFVCGRLLEDLTHA